MKFMLEIEMNHAAFEPDDPSPAGLYARQVELRRVLSQVAEHLSTDTRPGARRTLFDSNGNRVGSWEIK